jgi:hypothetical protein
MNNFGLIALGLLAMFVNFFFLADRLNKMDERINSKLNAQTQLIKKYQIENVKRFSDCQKIVFEKE